MENWVKQSPEILKLYIISTPNFYLKELLKQANFTIFQKERTKLPDLELAVGVQIIDENHLLIIQDYINSLIEVFACTSLSNIPKDRIVFQADYQRLTNKGTIQIPTLTLKTKVKSYQIEVWSNNEDQYLLPADPILFLEHNFSPKQKGVLTQVALSFKQTEKLLICQTVHDYPPQQKVWTKSLIAF